MGGPLLHYDDSDAADSDESDFANGTVSGGHSTTALSANGTARSHNGEDYDFDELMTQWKRMFPSRLKPGDLDMPDLITFLERALALVSHSEEHMEDAIIMLTTEGGLTRVRQLLDRNFDKFTGGVLSKVWHHLLLIYLKIVAHDTVLDSETVDRRRDLLMSELYGDHGKRGAAVFRTALRGLLVDIRETTIEKRTCQGNLEICIAVLSCMVLHCSPTSMSEEFCKIANEMLSLLGKPHLNKNTEDRVLSLRAVLTRSLPAENGASASPANVAAPTASAKANVAKPAVHVQPPKPQATFPVPSEPPSSTAVLIKPAVAPQATFKLRKPKAATPAVFGALTTGSRGLKATTVTASAPSPGPGGSSGGDSSPVFARHDNDKEHIFNIQIMPTLKEVQCNKPAYLPREDPSSWHKSGMPGVIDRHFRLLREDTVGQLRLAARLELDALQNPNPTPKPVSSSKEKEKDYDHYEPDNKGARTNVYNGASLDRVLFDPSKGMQFILTINQPPATSRLNTSVARQNWWKHEQRLGPDSLICLLSSDGGVHFLVVHNPPPPKPGKEHSPNALHKRYTLGLQRDKAFVIAELATTNPDDASALLRTLADTTSRRCLVEFPGQILQSFAPTLAALQIMSRNTKGIQLSHALTPDANDYKPTPPAYSQARGFQYQLQALLSEQERNRSGRASMESILKRSVLDDKQQVAVKHALTNELALIQGPPGTGKSFTGVKLIEALLENRDAANLGPIVCVCFTNHALDQLLEHLMDTGVRNIIRMGSRSKSERLAPLNIREVAKNYSFERGQGGQMGRAKKHIKKAVQNIYALINRWHSVVSQKHAEDAEIMTLLARDYPALHNQLMALDTGHGHFSRSRVQEWLQRGLNTPTSQATDKSNTNNRKNMCTMSSADRKTLHQQLLASVFDELYQELGLELQLFYEHKSTIDMVRGELDLQALADAGVIGVTTSGLAGKYKRLRKLRSKVVVVEEAGEVLEAHLLTAMLPSIQHAVFIGDHRQLRPKVNNYDLSIDNPCSRITLDVSLFERLVRPRFDDSPGLSFVTLEMQRRMHPSISNLIRSTLYPNLCDAPNVLRYPEVAGMTKRIFWLDHRNKEDDTRNNPQSVSQSNKWEVDMVAGLVGHLSKQGVYSAGDIAVLTPYSGQVKELQAKLGRSFGIMLSERDIDDGIQDSGAKVRTRNAIRLSTVDAFQGEEAKVIIISMVRSNEKKMCGFLGTENRINVLLSRAMHGMYVIGNSHTTSDIPMWRNVVSLFKAGGNFGPALEVACGRHPHSGVPVLVSQPREFSRASPEAGCFARCEED